jgi:hypothetical protein
MINKMKLRLYVVLIMTIFSLNVMAQEEEDNTGKLPVRSPFEAEILIDNPTIVNPLKGALELNIQHRFGLIKANGTKDLFGIYAPSKIRLGLNYGITDRIMVGIGTTNFRQLQDINWKVALIRQNRSGSIPVSVSYYGNFVIDAREKEAFGPTDKFRAIHRFSYFSEIIVARKFSDIFSFQLAPNFTYFNAIDAGMKNMNVGLSAGGRAKIFSSSSIIFEFDHSFMKSDILTPKPNLGIGYEIGTATHCFQVFASTYDKILPQYNYAFNSNDLGKKEFLLGFNITVRF